MISVCGIIVSTLALVCALSVFNGFTDVVAQSFSAFDPELQITTVQGKVFDPTQAEFEKVKSLSGISFVSEALEEKALVKFGENQQPATIKGVSADFERLANIDHLIIDGDFMLRDGDIDYGVMGVGLAMNLDARPKFITPLKIYMPKRNEKVNMANPTSAFTRSDVYLDGVFALNQAKYDDQMLIVSIDLVRQLLDYEKEVSSLDIKVKDGMSVTSVQREIQQILGEKYLVKDRFQQQEDMFRMVSVEKWVTFFILAVILAIAVFNVVGSLSMLIIEKNEDIKILQSLGASNSLISRIFFYEGCLIVFVGAILGLLSGLAICLLQQEFGLLRLGSTPGVYLIDAYPVSVQVLDVILVFITVSIIGISAVMYPINNLRKRLQNHQI